MSTSESTYNIIDLRATSARTIDQVAELLFQAFKFTSPDSWPDMESAFAEIHESLEPGRISRIAMQNDGEVGTALVKDLKSEILARGGTTLWLGTDDESNRTSLGGKSLYPDVLAKLSTFRTIQRHPIEFFQKVGFSIVGVIPDANGIGKPDILMAMRVGH